MSRVYYRYMVSLVEDGVAEWMPAESGRLLDTYLLRNQPWFGLHLEWQKIPNAVSLYWGQSTEEEVARFMQTTTLSGYPRVAAFYGETSPVLSFATDWAFWNLDRASAYTQGYFLFGCHGKAVDLTAFAELDTGRQIWAVGHSHAVPAA